jgi:transposase
MDTNTLFRAALGLAAPWEVESVAFDPKGAEGRGQLDIRLTFPRGSRFPCPDCGEPSPAHDTSEQRWRHLDFFQHEAYLVAPLPRSACPRHGVLTVSVPWARDGSGFTLLFEAYVMFMAPEMPMRALARAVREHDTRLWRLVKDHVEEARERVDMSHVREIVVDETSQAKGHEYVTLFVAPGQEKAQVLFVADGRKNGVFGEFVQDLEAHGGSPSKVRDVCMDMSEAFQKGAADFLPGAKITFDRFHVVKLVNEAVDEVRRTEQASQPDLKGSRYTWIKNPANLTYEQFATFKKLHRRNLDTVDAYHMRLNLQDMWKLPSEKVARAYLLKWCKWVRSKAKKRPGLAPMLRVAKTIRSKFDGILHYFRRRLTSGVIEGINSIVQAARARARGYRNPETYKTIIYLIAGRLRFNLPALTH